MEVLNNAGCVSEFFLGGEKSTVSGAFHGGHVGASPKKEFGNWLQKPVVLRLSEDFLFPPILSRLRFSRFLLSFKDFKVPDNPGFVGEYFLRHAGSASKRAGSVKRVRERSESRVKEE